MHPPNYRGLRGHVCSRVDFLWKCWDSHSESFLDLLKDLGVGVAGDKGDCKTLRTETASTTDSMQVGVGVGRGVLKCVSFVSLWTRYY